MRVVIAEDQALFRDSLRALLEVNGIEVVGEASTGTEAVALAKSLEPDVMLMDLEMPELDGIEATKQIHQELPDLNIVILTGSEDESDLFRAFEVGVQGFLIKNMAAHRVLPLLERVADGEPAIGPEVARILMNQSRVKRRTDPDALTERELEVLALMTNGTTSNRQLARSLEVSENTVKFHVRNILDKLHLHSRAEAVGHALRNRLVQPTSSGALASEQRPSLG